MTNDAFTDRARDILIAGIQAGRHGRPPQDDILAAVTSGDRDLGLDRLGFDSLAWMEFLICVELRSGLELTVADIAAMEHVFQIEDWLRARL